MRVVIQLLFLFLFLNGSISRAQESNEEYNLLWKISGNGLQEPSFLFGTMHVKDNRAFNFSDSVFIAIEKSDVFALEVNPDSMMSMMFKKLFAKDTIDVLREQLETDEYELLKEKFRKKNGYELDQMKSKNPFLIRSLLKPDYDREDDRQTFVDGYLGGIAKTLGKEVIGLENAQTQSDLYFGSSKSAQRKMVVDLLHEDSTYNQFFMNKMVTAYGKGSLDEIEKMIPSIVIEDSIFIGRNQVMLRSILRVIEEKSLFAAVGSAHLLGDQGLVSLLRNQGYKVNPVKATYDGLTKEYAIDISKMKWHTYTDEKAAFSIEMPGKPFATNILQELDMKMYADISTGSYFILSTMDFRGASKTIDEDAFIQRIAENYKNGRNTILKKKRINKNGYSALELLMEVSAGQQLRLQIFIRNNIFYALGAGGNKKLLKEPYVNRFFDSFEGKTPPPMVSKEWELYTNEKGAFSVYLPGEPKETVNRESNPMDPDSDPYEVYLYITTDMSTLNNYLLVYNDLPPGYFLDDKELALNELVSNMESNGTLLKNDSISLDGVEGREVEIMLMDQYLMNCKIYVRNNRIYKVCKQNLEVGEKDFDEDDYFSSFSFLPYQKSDFVDYIDSAEGFKMKQFSKKLVLDDSSSRFETYVYNSTQHFTTNDASGGVYQLEVAELDDYFRIHHLDSFYVEYCDLLAGWSDTIISNDSIQIGGQYGREMVMENTFNKSIIRYRLWLDNQRIYLMSASVGKDELFNETANKYFSSFEKTAANEPFDLYSSKTSKILESLNSQDSLERAHGIGAFDYHKFDLNDLPLLHDALNKKLTDDSLVYGAKGKIISAIGGLNQKESLIKFTELYESDSSSDAIQSNILESLIDMEDGIGLNTFLELFLNDPPQEPKMKWKMFRPFWDSLALASDNIDGLLRLMSNKNYKSNVLSISSSLLTSDSGIYADVVLKNKEQLLASAFQDLDTYLEDLKEEETDYKYNMWVGNYLNLLENLENSLEFTEKFTQKILDAEAEKYMELRAVCVRIRKQLKVDKKLVKKLLSNSHYRSDIIEAYESVGEKDELSSKYTSKKALAELRLQNYLEYEYGEAEGYELLGELSLNDSKFYVYSFSFEDEEEKYIGIVGGFPIGDVPFKFAEIRAYSSWEELKGDWKPIAEQMIEEWREEHEDEWE